MVIPYAIKHYSLLFATNYTLIDEFVLIQSNIYLQLSMKDNGAKLHTQFTSQVIKKRKNK